MSRKKRLSEKLSSLNQFEEPVVSPSEEMNVEPEEITGIDTDTEVLVSAETGEEDHDEFLIKRSLQEERRKKRWRKVRNGIHLILILSCVYLGFLIYSTVVTTFEYDGSGSILPQRMTRTDISERNEYEKIYYYYEGCRTLYENTLMLDYRLGAGEEDPLAIAPEYESLLDTVETLSIKTDALNVETGYSQVKSMLLTWIQDDIAVYLQNMSAAISQNNTETANNALQDRDRVYTDFMLITQNMAALGENIKGVDLTSIRHWTPENYIDEEINGETS